MKKYIGIILLIIACTLTSCGEDETTAAAPEPVSGSEILDESKPEQISSVEIRDEGTVYVKTFSDGSVSGDEPLPLELKITYELDGVDLTADEIKDKSGHLKMRFEYKNMTAYKSVQAPLAAVTVMMLDEEVFSNIVAQNARVSKTGDAWLCMGATFPGLKDSLGLSGWERTKDIDFVVTADFFVKNNDKIIGYGMPYIKGKKMPYSNGLNKKKNIMYLKQLSEHLKKLHDLGIIVADFDHNYLIQEDGNLKLIDHDNFSIDNLDIDSKNNFVLNYIRKMGKFDKKFDDYFLNLFTISMLYNKEILYLFNTGSRSFKEWPKDDEICHIIKNTLDLTNTYNEDLIVDKINDKKDLKKLRKRLF